MPGMRKQNGVVNQHPAETGPAVGGVVYEKQNKSPKSIYVELTLKRQWWSMSKMSKSHIKCIKKQIVLRIRAAFLTIKNTATSTQHKIRQIK